VNRITRILEAAEIVPLCTNCGRILPKPDALAGSLCGACIRTAEEAAWVEP